jgi:alanine dehydrogenase
MILGIPKEIKPQEYRVALTPEAVAKLTKDGHTVFIQKGAGEACGFFDRAFRESGAKILSDARKIWEKAELILKVKEPIPKEYNFFRPGLLLFTFLHLANAPALARALMKKGVTALGYETVTAADGSLPLLKPMSEIAGKLAVLVGAEYLRTDRGKKGILLSHVEGTRRGRITILGAGNVGRAALEVAAGIGAQVTLIDRSEEKLKRVLSPSPSTGEGRGEGDSVETILFNPTLLPQILSQTDLLIGAVLIPGARAPKLVTRKMVASMQPGSVIVDVSVDQGGCIETTQPTTHAHPIYTYKKIIHYGVTNMPSLVAHSATEALVSKTFSYVKKLADQGLSVLNTDMGFHGGLQIHKGEIVHPEVRRALG